MNSPKLLTREEFKEQVFARDGYKCVFCDLPAKDAHHILERRLFIDLGYYLDNGASVCEQHHLDCERTILSVDDTRTAAGITRRIVPPHFYDDHEYDKWGNPLLDGNRRGRGELFFDESVQKVLGEGGKLDLFTPYVKYGRTFHLPFSPGLHDDDKALRDCSQFEGKRVIISKKMDGENTTMYRDHIHARSIDSRGGEDRAWVKQFWSTISYEIPENWRICGENLWAEHSLSYVGLKSFFYGFSMWNERNICLSWDETLIYFELLGITPVETVFDGIWDEKAVRKLMEAEDYTKNEGFVVRVADAFSYGQFKSSIAKYVRAGHVNSSKHWRAGRQFIQNGLKDVSTYSGG